AVDLRSINDVFEDGLRKRVRPLKNHADAAAYFGYVFGENVLAVQSDFTFDSGIPQSLVNAVQIPQKCGLPATGRTNQGRDAVSREVKRDILQSAELTIIKVDVRSAHLRVRAL